ncbi:similar to Saccharomyces cerevisiae YHR108W GGA2 Protein that interacts with and regulates Arf1p and Arf2p in a GTP-dependent manner to facilitate traffic through the late Golgi [Maudiozyma saulgeensis]|uniref:Similar to Saccharomyces cerevisiae YHR108W GGA2 Protein that interacts with and regulates Arf1p and Arf2p in a GTP-dependent manner to facilitate traffic through the late Golgi n=1 Tax=Maudiozyma saulgeensis TaxID=1789683 RepID=A0A1X7R2D1_9SACH|nr:similar to Saccharomyces cerevisiae YHR108W GGA2 Protein that interacts with and regulates Arf1p and Arf2p in a GTP-dependent manner to facilitate traffic through the late Golgi [Kazachstania saulgeensis]
MSHGVYLGDTPVRRPGISTNPLMRKIQRACRMTLPEPDIALNLDVADYINEKQGATAHDATTTIVKLINSRDTHTAVFALSLLDVLVKNCGYPIHLQISRKDFLNELVKRFPEHPPMRYSKVQRLILTAIEEWYQTVSKHSPYKDDMTYIRDMRRLLKYKGYVLPKIQAEDLAVMRPTDQLKSVSEIQKEQEIAQAAKLEELIRSGKPDDLREANKLMKVMAGFKEDNMVNAKQSINTELNKLKRKADLLNEMLNTSTEADLQNNETVEELYSALKTSQPKFQKIIEEEHEDDDLVQSLLKFNDAINQLIEKYALLKIGNREAAERINPANLNDVTNNISQTGGALANEINLIDFDDDTGAASPAPASSSAGSSNNNSNSDPLIDLLGDLNISSTPITSTNTTNNNQFLSSEVDGGISLDSTVPPSSSNTVPISASSGDPFDLLSDFSSPNVSTPTANLSAPTATTTSPIITTPSATANSSVRANVSKSAKIQIDVLVSREDNSTIKIKTLFSNSSPDLVKDFVYSMAVPKSFNLKLQPQSSSTLAAFTNEGVHQNALVENAVRENLEKKPLKIKWKATYNINSNPVEETAIFQLPVV